MYIAVLSLLLVAKVHNLCCSFIHVASRICTVVYHYQNLCVKCYMLCVWVVRYRCFVHVIVCYSVVIDVLHYQVGVFSAIYIMYF
jgi:hypothetical protein